MRRFRCLVLGFLLLGVAPAVLAQGELHPIVSNGPVVARFNLVVLSEGYTAAQKTRFLTDATNVINTLFAREPYQEYQSWFNAFALVIPSVQSGADHPAYGQYKDTYFNSTYDASDRIITIPAGATGQGRMDALLAAHLPDYDLAILLVNDPVPGGSDGAARTAISSVSGVATILIHETGHVVAGLGDEYTTPNPGYPDVEAPNTTRETNRAQIKWKAWIDETTPLPTPPTLEFQDLVGLFEGAHYHPTGWYRPKLNCTMQSQYTPDFCEVCREALVLAFHQRVRPIAAATPAASMLTITNTHPVMFSVSVLQPASHQLSVQWQTNGIPVAGAVHPQFSLLPGTLASGQHTLSAVVADLTPHVRTDPTGLLWETNTWELQVDSIAHLPLNLSAPQRLPDGTLALAITGSAGQVAIEISTNLDKWIEAGTVSLVGGQARYTNAPAAGTPGTFFRARALP